MVVEFGFVNDNVCLVYVYFFIVEEIEVSLKRNSLFIRLFVDLVFIIFFNVKDCVVDWVGMLSKRERGFVFINL